MTPTQFKDARKRLGFTQTILANELGLTIRQVCRYESGETPIPKLVKTILILGLQGKIKWESQSPA